MNCKQWMGGVVLIVAGLIVMSGCQPEAPSSPKEEKPKTAKNKEGHGWWCDEHAMPEEVCDLCDKKYRDAERVKGNWCEHERVKTSCFKCNPGLKEKFAKEYEDKYGKKPPEPEPEEPETKSDPKGGKK